MGAGDTSGDTGPARGRWRRALGLIWGVSPRLVVVVLVTTCCGALTPALNVVLIGSVVDSVAQVISDGASGTDLWVYAAWMAGLILYGQVLMAAQGYAESLLQPLVANEFSLQIMRKAGELELVDFENSEVYNSLQLANREAGFRPYQLFSQLIAAVSSAVALVSVAAVIVQWNAVVAVVMVLAPIVPVATDLVYGRRVWLLERERAEPRRRGQYLHSLVTNDRAFKETRLLGLTTYFIGRYKAMLDGFYLIDRGIERVRTVSTSLSGLVGVVATGLALYLAVRDAVVNGDIGRLAAYITALSAVAASAQMFLAGLGELVEHSLFLSNLFAFLDRPGTRVRSGTATVPPRLRVGIEFDHVTFRYPGETSDALTDFCLTIPAGSTVALVGENGAGKTTLVKLLTRLYEPSSGEIRIDGTPLADYDRAALRSSIAVLFQDYLHYEATARENIGFGSVARMADDAALWEAARSAGAADIVRGLPSGLETQLGKWFADGHQLSGGQWQRVGLARALFAAAPVLVLDEPTAALDAAAEAEVFDQLARVEATTLLVAHRFSTVRTATKIAVIEDGRVSEEGTHDELMALGGLYSRLFTLQAKGYRDDSVTLSN